MGGMDDVRRAWAGEGHLPLALRTPAVRTDGLRFLATLPAV
jgi:hypothetical protein